MSRVDKYRELRKSIGYIENNIEIDVNAKVADAEKHEVRREKKSSITKAQNVSYSNIDLEELRLRASINKRNELFDISNIRSGYKRAHPQDQFSDTQLDIMANIFTNNIKEFNSTARIKKLENTCGDQINSEELIRNLERETKKIVSANKQSQNTRQRPNNTKQSIVQPQKVKVAQHNRNTKVKQAPVAQVQKPKANMNNNQGVANEEFIRGLNEELLRNEPVIKAKTPNVNREKVDRKKNLKKNDDFGSDSMTIVDYIFILAIVVLFIGLIYMLIKYVL